MGFDAGLEWNSVMGSCTLCGLPTPTPPITGGSEDQSYCCEGCKRVDQSLDEFAIESGGSIDSTTESTESIPDGADEEFFSVTGMHCTTCERFLSLKGDSLEGVYRVETNYGLETARVHYDPDTWDESELGEGLSGHGYQFRPRSETSPGHGQSETTRTTVQRLIVGGFFSMLIMPWYFFYLYPLYVGFDEGLLSMGRTTTMGIYFPLVVIGGMTTAVLVYTGYPILRGAWISIKTRQPNMDLLVAIAALAAYCYSLLALALGQTHLYFDVTVMVVMVVTLGRYYEGKLRSTATDELRDLTKARVDEANRITNAGREMVEVDELEAGDEVLVEPGERIPLDGIVSRGTAMVDEAIVTGESHPVAKSTGDEVLGGAKVVSEPVTMTIGQDESSTVDRIATAMWEIQTNRPGIQRFADALATIFVPLVLVLGVSVTIVRLWSGDSVSTALLWGLTILLVSCPCAMGLATPLAVSGGLRDALRSGIVVTDESIFEVAPDVETVIFDKTGTLTHASVEVCDVIGHDQTLEQAAAIERFDSHPIANAIVDAAVENPSIRMDGGTTRADGQKADEREEQEHSKDLLTRHPGEGVSGVVDGRRVYVGTASLMESNEKLVPPAFQQKVDRFRANGRSAVLVAWDGAVRGVIGFEDRARERWEDALERFADREVVILTGDDRAAAETFAAHPAVDHTFAGVPPEGKTATVSRFVKEGTTVMIGDGSNDAPALAAADLGIAIGDGTAEAAQAAAVVLTDPDLRRLDRVFTLAQGTRRRIRENIGWALMYNAIALPLAVVGLINPFFAAVAMALSSVIVVSNSRRPIIDRTVSFNP